MRSSHTASKHKLTVLLVINGFFSQHGAGAVTCDASRQGHLSIPLGVLCLVSVVMQCLTGSLS